MRSLNVWAHEHSRLFAQVRMRSWATREKFGHRNRYARRTPPAKTADTPHSLRWFETQTIALAHDQQNLTRAQFVPYKV